MNRSTDNRIRELVLQQAHDCVSRIAQNPETADWIFLSREEDTIRRFVDVCARATSPRSSERTDVIDALRNPAAIGVDKLSRRLKRSSGVLSLHARYSEPVATLIALVESAEAEKLATTAERDILGKTGEFPVDFLVYLVDPVEAGRLQESLESSFSLIWKRK